MAILMLVEGFRDRLLSLSFLLSSSIQTSRALLATKLHTTSATWPLSSSSRSLTVSLTRSCGYLSCAKYLLAKVKFLSEVNPLSALSRAPATPLLQLAPLHLTPLAIRAQAIRKFSPRHHSTLALGWAEVNATRSASCLDLKR